MPQLPFEEASDHTHIIRQVSMVMSQLRNETPRAFLSTTRWAANSMNRQMKIEHRVETCDTNPVKKKPEDCLRVLWSHVISRWRSEKRGVKLFGAAAAGGRVGFKKKQRSAFVCLFVYSAFSRKDYVVYYIRFFKGLTVSIDLKQDLKPPLRWTLTMIYCNPLVLLLTC